jgi:hypothetical protein
MSPKNVTKVVWYILVQLSFLNNTMSGSKVQGSEVQGLKLLVSGSDRGLPFFIGHLSSAMLSPTAVSSGPNGSRPMGSSQADLCLLLSNL